MLIKGDRKEKIKAEENDREVRVAREGKEKEGENVMGMKVRDDRKTHWGSGGIYKTIRSLHCVLLHFVLTRCMRLLGNSPYAPFIYNSAANAGHAARTLAFAHSAHSALKRWNNRSTLFS